MNTLEQLIHKIATDSEFRGQIQSNGALAAGLSWEETDALYSLRHLLQLSTEELHQLLFDDLPLGWI